MAVSQTLNVTQSSQSVSGNYSKVRIVWQTTQTGESYNGYEKTAYYYVSINGGAETKYSVKYTLPKGTTKTLVDKTITVNHTPDGKGSAKVRTWMNTGISAGTIQKSDSLTLTTIPRATTPSLSASSVDMGGNVTIDLPRASSSFTHDLAYKVGSSNNWITFKTGATTTYTWTTPDLADMVPNATSLGITLRVITKSGSTTVGTKTAALTLKVPTSVKPIVDNLSVAEATSGLAAQFGAFVQNKSTLRVGYIAVGQKGSTIVERKATVTGFSGTFTSAPFTTGIVTRSGSVTVTVQVKDSRGRWSDAKSHTITVQAYAKPKLTALRVYRCDAAGNADDNGENIAVNYGYSVTSLGGKNTTSMVLQYKRETDASYSSTLLTDSAQSINTTVKPTSPTFSIDYSYDLRMVVTDWFGETVEATVELSSAEVIVDIGADGKSLGIGETAQAPGLNIGWPIVGQVLGAWDTSGYYKTHDGLLIQWGTRDITPTAANTPTITTINFPYPYAYPPGVAVVPLTSVPQNVSVGILRAVSGSLTDPAKGVGVVLTRTGTTTTTVYWLAIGKAL